LGRFESMSDDEGRKVAQKIIRIFADDNVSPVDARQLFKDIVSAMVLVEKTEALIAMAVEQTADMTDRREAML